MCLGWESEKRTSIVEGRARKSYGHSKPIGTWEVMIKDHHEGYISWAEYERNQKQLALNNYGRTDGVKSGRGGKALLSGMMTCGRCGRRLSVAYTGNPQSRPVYRCDKPNLMMGLPRCMIFGGSRVDAAIAEELLRVVEPLAIEAALEAERMHQQSQDDQQRILDLELQQARYEASLAERRYAACDPDNRRVAQSNGVTDRTKQDMDRASRVIRTPRARHSCLQIGGKGRRMAHDDRGGKGSERHEPHDSSPHQSRRSPGRPGCSRRTVPNP